MAGTSSSSSAGKVELTLKLKGQFSGRIPVTVAETATMADIRQMIIKEKLFFLADPSEITMMYREEASTEPLKDPITVAELKVKDKNDGIVIDGPIIDAYSGRILQQLRTDRLEEQLESKELKRNLKPMNEEEIANKHQRIAQLNLARKSLSKSSRAQIAEMIKAQSADATTGAEPADQKNPINPPPVPPRPEGISAALQSQNK